MSQKVYRSHIKQCIIDSISDDREGTFNNGPVHNGENSGTNNVGNNFNSPQVGEVGTMTGNIEG